MVYIVGIGLLSGLTWREKIRAASHERLRPGRPPLILQIAEHGRRLVRPTRFQKAPLAPDELAKSIVSFPTQVTTELSRLFMEIAVILEKAA